MPYTATPKAYLHRSPRADAFVTDERTERKPVWRPSFLSILLSVSVFAMLIALATALLP